MEDVGRSNMYCLKSANYPSHLTAGLIGLLEDEDCPLADVTVGCEGQFIQAHRVVLALSSPFFKEFFKINRINNKTGSNCLIVLTNVKFVDIKNILQFMYHGKITLSSGELGSFLEAAKVLQIQDLTTEMPNFGHSERLDDNSVRNRDVPDINAHPKVTTSFTISASQRKRSRMRGIAQLATCSGVSTQAPVGSLHAPAAVNISQQQQPCSSTVAAAVHRLEQNPSSIGDCEPINYDDPLGDEHGMNEDGSEEMINLDAVKRERIEVYQSFESSENAMSFGNMEGTGVAGTSGNSGIIGYSSYEPMQAGSATRQLAGSSSVMNPPHMSVNPGTSSSKKSKPAGHDVSNRKSLANYSRLTKKQKTKYKMCVYCGGVFYKSNLSRHQKKSHSERLMEETCGRYKHLLSCDLCGQSYLNIANLRTHMRRNHPGEDYVDSLLLLSQRNQMTIRCKLCNVMMSQELFNSPTHLCVRSTGTGVVDPVVCVLCLRTFKNPNSLKVHKSTYHKKTREGLPPISSGVRLAHLVDVYPIPRPDSNNAFSREFDIDSEPAADKKFSGEAETLSQ